jgi:hypothetical protein
MYMYLVLNNTELFYQQKVKQKAALRIETYQHIRNDIYSNFCGSHGLMIILCTVNYKIEPNYGKMWQSYFDFYLIFVWT